MPKPAATDTNAQPFAKGSIIWEKKGPLPVWAWAGLLLAVLLAWAWWRRSRAEKAGNMTATAYTDELPGDQSSPAIFILPPEANTPGTPPTQTVPGAPPGAGREAPPGVVGQWVVVGQPIPTAGGTTAPAGNTLDAIAGQIWGHSDWWGSLAKDETNAGIPRTNIPVGTRVWVSGTPGPNP